MKLTTETLFLVNKYLNALDTSVLKYSVFGLVPGKASGKSGAGSAAGSDGGSGGAGGKPVSMAEVVKQARAGKASDPEDGLVMETKLKIIEILQVII